MRTRGWMTGCGLVVIGLLAAGCLSSGRRSREQARQAVVQADLQRALRLARAGKTDRAVAVLQSTLDVAPDNLPTRLFLASLHRETGNMPAALTQYDELLRQLDQSTNVEERLTVHVNRGDCLMALSRFEEAEADFEAALTLKPGEALLLVKRAETRMGRRQYDQALVDLAAATRAAPHEPSAWMRLGDCHFAQTNLAAAADDYAAALTRSPRDPALYARRAAVLAAMGQDEKALADYARALELDPESARRWYDRAMARLALDQGKEAIADFSEALKREPNRPEILVARGLAHELAGDDSRALEDYRRAYAMAPDYAPAGRELRRLEARLAAPRSRP